MSYYIIIYVIVIIGIYVSNIPIISLCRHIWPIGHKIPNIILTVKEIPPLTADCHVYGKRKSKSRPSKGMTFVNFNLTPTLYLWYYSSSFIPPLDRKLMKSLMCICIMFKCCRTSCSSCRRKIRNHKCEDTPRHRRKNTWNWHLFISTKKML